MKTETTKPEIKAVHGIEPHREGEYAACFAVGHEPFLGSKKVASIGRREQNLGTYGIVWYIALDAAGNEMGAMNAAYVSMIQFKEPDDGSSSS